MGSTHSEPAGGVEPGSQGSLPCAHGAPTLSDPGSRTSVAGRPPPGGRRSMALGPSAHFRLQLLKRICSDAKKMFCFLAFGAQVCSSLKWPFPMLSLPCFPATHSPSVLEERITGEPNLGSHRAPNVCFAPRRVVSRDVVAVDASSGQLAQGRPS